MLCFGPVTNLQCNAAVDSTMNSEVEVCCVRDRVLRAALQHVVNAAQFQPVDTRCQFDDKSKKHLRRSNCPDNNHLYHSRRRPVRGHRRRLASTNLAARRRQHVQVPPSIRSSLVVQRR